MLVFLYVRKTIHIFKISLSNNCKGSHILLLKENASKYPVILSLISFTLAVSLLASGRSMINRWRACSCNLILEISKEMKITQIRILIWKLAIWLVAERRLALFSREFVFIKYCKLKDYPAITLSCASLNIINYPLSLKWYRQDTQNYYFIDL